MQPHAACLGPASSSIAAESISLLHIRSSRSRGCLPLLCCVLKAIFSLSRTQSKSKNKEHEQCIVHGSLSAILTIFGIPRHTHGFPHRLDHLDPSRAHPMKRMQHSQVSHSHSHNLTTSISFSIATCCDYCRDLCKLPPPATPAKSRMHKHDVCSNDKQSRLRRTACVALPRLLLLADCGIKAPAGGQKADARDRPSAFMQQGKEGQFCK